MTAGTAAPASTAVTAMLEARSVALVGASARPGSLGARMIDQMARSPVAPSASKAFPKMTAERALVRAASAS